MARASLYGLLSLGSASRQRSGAIPPSPQDIYGREFDAESEHFNHSA